MAERSEVIRFMASRIGCDEDALQGHLPLDRFGDSLDTLSLAMDVEKEFDVDFRNWVPVTVGDMVGYVVGSHSGRSA